VSLGPKFDPIDALFRADAALEEFNQFIREHGDAPSRAELEKFSLHLTDTEQNLGHHLAYYRGATPSRAKFIGNFAVGLAGVLTTAPTLGLSLIVTCASVWISLNDSRSYVDNLRQMDRIELRLRHIEDALEEIERLAPTAS
jgi:hypothetical protein